VALLSGKKFDSRLDYVTQFAKDLKRPVDRAMPPFPLNLDYPK
jgi:hypothetical protein